MRLAIYAATLSVCLSACASLQGSEPAPLSSACQLKAGTDWVANSPDWRTAAEATYASASAYVEQYAKAHPSQNWAVVMDVDETVINNVEYQIERDLSCTSYTSETWYRWTQKTNATLVPGVKDFIDTVNQLGGHVAFVTNRKDTEQFATEKNLKKLGLKRQEDFRILITRSTPDGARDKQPRFDVVPAMLTSMGYPNSVIAAFVGDGAGDKPASTTAQFFCVDQGNMYGEPCALPSGSGQVRD